MDGDTEFDAMAASGSETITLQLMRGNMTDTLPKLVINRNGSEEAMVEEETEAAAEEVITDEEPRGESAGPGEEHKDKATVKAVQQALNDAGYDCGKPDGAAGKKTKAAITAYQTDKGLTVTGTVTDELLASLGLD